MNNEEAAQREWEQALKEYGRECDELKERLKREGRDSKGLDGNVEEFRNLTQKLTRRMHEIREKYKIKPQGNQNPPQ